MVLNATDKEICLRENRIIGTLEPYHQDVEGYISTVAESLNEIRKIGGNGGLLNSVISDGNERMPEVSASFSSQVATVSGDKTSQGKGTDRSESAPFSTTIGKNNQPSAESTKTLPLLLNKDIQCGKTEYQDRVRNLLNSYRDVLTRKGESIGATNIIEHKIELKDPNVILNKYPYRIPHRYKESLSQLTQEMLDEPVTRGQ